MWAYAAYVLPTWFFTIFQEKTASDRIFVGKPGTFDQEQLFDDVEELWQLADVHNIKEVLVKLMELVPGFSTRKLKKTPTFQKSVIIPDQILARKISNPPLSEPVNLN